MITVCENCHQTIWPDDGQGHWMHHPLTRDPRKYERDGQPEGVLHCSTFNPTLPHSAVATYGIEAWETDSPTLVVVGTQDREVAYKVAHRMYSDLVGDVPEELAEAIADASTEWVNREHPDYTEETWPDDVLSTVERDGDTPALAYQW